MVEWAGLEIRSLSQDRGFESLSLLETKSEAERLRFLFQRLGMRTLAEGSTNSPRAKRTRASLGLRRSRNPKGDEGNEVTESSHPSLPQQRVIKKHPPHVGSFLFQRQGMRTLAEGSIDRARAKRTQRGQGLRRSRNPEGGEGNEVSVLSNPSHTLTCEVK